MVILLTPSHLRHPGHSGHPGLPGHPDHPGHPGQPGHPGYPVPVSQSVLQGGVYHRIGIFY